MLAQAYHWTLEDIKRLSYTQVLMLQHAATYNRKLLDKRLEENRKKGLSPTEEWADSARPITELTSDELIALAGPENGKGPKIIKLRQDAPHEPDEED